MIYRATNPNLPHFIDRYKTGNYGEDIIKESLHCNRCGALVKHGESYYILDDFVYCMNCRMAAEEHILKDVSERYIYVL